MKIFLVLFAAMALWISTGIAVARTAIPNPASYGPPYQSALLMEPETGQILVSYEPHKLRPPASLTKMMVMLIVMERVHEGSISLTDKVVASAQAQQMGGSQVFLAVGEVFTLEELMKAVAIHSANDAAVAVAEYVAGTVEAFVDMMNHRARQLGMTETIFHSAHGLPPGPTQGGDVTSAWDLAILARRLVGYPQILRWCGTEEEGFRGGKFILTNTNKLVKHFRGLDGLKTGYHQMAGFNIVATASRQGLRFIAVVLGAPTGQVRFSEAARILNRGFNHYRKIIAIKGGTQLEERIQVIEGAMGALRPVVSRDAMILIRRGEEKKIKVEPRLVSSVRAPVPKDEKVGVIRILVDGTVRSEIPAIVAEEIPRASLFWRLWERLFSFFKQLLSYLWGWVKGFWSTGNTRLIGFPTFLAWCDSHSSKSLDLKNQAWHPLC